MLLALVGGAVAFVLVATGSLIAGAVAGLLVLGAALFAIRASIPEDPGRRRFLGLMGGLGLAAVAAGTAAGAVVRRLTRPDPRPALEAMASDLGSEYLELVTRSYNAERLGDLQLLVTPYSSSNYPQESLSLAPNDPRSSHAVTWMYGERVPIVVWSPGRIEPQDHTERVTLADLAPTTARLMGFDEFRAADGVALPGIPTVTPPVQPRVVVTLVIDGGGWNVLRRWPDAWPNLKRLMREGATYRNAISGSFPAVTASTHATIGTGAFPRTHGITGHNVRRDGGPVKAWGEPGDVDPSFLLEPTLADRWTEWTRGPAWVGEIGYQVWHVGMLGRGGRPMGEAPVGVYWDEDGGGGWRPHHPRALPAPEHDPRARAPRRADRRVREPPLRLRRTTRPARRRCAASRRWCATRASSSRRRSTPSRSGRTRSPTCCTSTSRRPTTRATSTTWTTRGRPRCSAPSTTRSACSPTCCSSGSAPAGSVLIVTADHGQCPEIDANGGVRIDPIQLEEDLNAEFGTSVFGLVQMVAPSEVYLDPKALTDSGLSAEDVAAFLADYRYGDNIGPYIRPAAIQRDRLHDRSFAAVLPATVHRRARAHGPRPVRRDAVHGRGSRTGCRPSPGSSHAR